MEPITREIISNNWITIILTLNLIVLVFAKVANPLKFADFTGLFSSNKFVLFNQKGNQLSSIFNVFLILMQALSISTFLFICIKVFELMDIKNDWIVFLKVFSFYLAFVVCKVLVEKIIGAIFSIDNLLDDYLFYKLSYRNFFGLILLPFNIIFIYTAEPSKIFIMIFIAAILLFNVIVMISAYKKNENLILNNLLYFILYLCALEIAPYFIVYKVLR